MKAILIAFVHVFAMMAPWLASQRKTQDNVK